MKKSLFLIPVSMLMLASCSNDEPVQNVDNNENNENNGITMTEDDWELSKELSLTSDEKAILSNFDEFNHNLISQFA